MTYQVLKVGLVVMVSVENSVELDKKDTFPLGHCNPTITKLLTYKSEIGFDLRKFFHFYLMQKDPSINA